MIYCAAPSLWSSFRRPLFCFDDPLHVPVEPHAIERNNDDLAAVIVVAILIRFRNVDDCECEVCNVSVLQVPVRSLHLLPVIYGPVLVSNELVVGS